MPTNWPLTQMASFVSFAAKVVRYVTLRCVEKVEGRG